MKTKKLFLENFDTIKFYTGNINEIAIIKKNNYNRRDGRAV